jgi:type IV pilus assembly protein PilW
MQESGRFAMDLITRDLRRAGYWGGNVDTQTIEGTLGRAVPQEGCPDASWARMVAWRVSGIDHADGTATYACATPFNTDSDTLTIRYAGPEVVATDPLTAGALNATTVYLRSTLFAGRIMAGVDAADSHNIIPPLDATAPAHLQPQIRRLVAHGYFIRDSATDACNGTPVPALHRVRLQPDGTLGVEELAPGIEQLQVRYLVGNQYVDADAVGNGWPDVSAVRVWILARSSCPESGLDNPVTYDMGNQSWPAATDDFRRQMYVTTIMLRNTLVR